MRHYTCTCCQLVLLLPTPPRSRKDIRLLPLLVPVFDAPHSAVTAAVLPAATTRTTCCSSGRSVMQFRLAGAVEVPSAAHTESDLLGQSNSSAKPPWAWKLFRVTLNCMKNLSVTCQAQKRSFSHTPPTTVATMTKPAFPVPGCSHTVELYFMRPKYRLLSSSSAPAKHLF